MTQWANYIDQFHRSNAGVTERVLGAARDAQGHTPYEWLAGRAVGSVVVDLGCGSGPLAPLAGPSWVGVDASEAELGEARVRRRGPLVRGDATAVPWRDGAASSVLAPMSLMVMQPLTLVLGEVRRILAPGAPLVALLPGKGALTLHDRVRYARLCLALRRQPAFPVPEMITDPVATLEAARFEVIDDEERRFVCSLEGPDATSTFVSSMYLPGVADRQLARAQRLAQRWTSIGAPLRLIVARAL